LAAGAHEKKVDEVRETSSTLRRGETTKWKTWDL
jgi:hypothetical protein